jgi:glycosyltransferase involved in cell wall biosynthesis
MVYDFSIITICFNSEATIARTLNSILMEANNFEGEIQSIIIDGGSNDSTILIVQDFISKKPNNLTVTFISEPDNGIYDAMNKGISLAKGQLVAILNSDDCYILGALNFVWGQFISKGFDVLHGDVIWRYSSLSTKDIFMHHSGNSQLSNLKKGMTINHPTVFCCVDVYNKLGMFDDRYKYVADWLWALQLIDTDYVVQYFPKELVIFDMGGVSNQVILSRALEIQKVYIFLSNSMYINYWNLLSMSAQLWLDYFISFFYHSVFPLPLRRYVSKFRKSRL